MRGRGLGLYEYPCIKGSEGELKGGGTPDMMSNWGWGGGRGFHTVVAPVRSTDTHAKSNIRPTFRSLTMHTSD